MDGGRGRRGGHTRAHGAGAVFTSAYVRAVSFSTSRLSSISHLLPAIAITMFSGPKDRSSVTQFCNVLNDV